MDRIVKIESKIDHLVDIIKNVAKRREESDRKMSVIDAKVDGLTEHDKLLFDGWKFQGYGVWGTHDSYVGATRSFMDCIKYCSNQRKSDPAYNGMTWIEGYG